jgi:hypothetical protein
MNLTVNGVVITDAIKFVQTKKVKLTTIFSKRNNTRKESEDQTMVDDKGQLEEKARKGYRRTCEQKSTTNQAF